MINRYVTTGLILLLLFTGCGSDKQKVNSVQKVAVEVDIIKTGDITVIKTFSGTLEGAEQSKIYASIPENVVDIPVSEGSYVKKGSPIIILDKNGATSQYNQAYAVYRNAKDNYEKMRNLYEQKAISEMNFKSVRTAYEVAKANFNAAKATVELSSPIDGIVTEIAVNLGQQAPLGMPIATVAKTKKMRLTIFAGLREIAKLTVGQPAKILFDSSDSISAVVAEISQSADPQTRLFRVELEMDNQNGKLKPGMYAKALVVVNNFKDVLTISNRAVFSEDGISKVYLIRNDTAYVKTIAIGASDGRRTQLLSDLPIGQQVVVVGKSALRDATPVLISNKDDENVPG